MLSIIAIINIFIIITILIKEIIIGREEQPHYHHQTDNNNTETIINTRLYPTDCSMTLTKCSSDTDCFKLCKHNNDMYCNEDNLCTYRNTPFCFHNGYLIQFYIYGELQKICSCPDPYYGPRCQWINPFKRINVFHFVNLFNKNE